MKTAELTGALLDYWVAKAEGLETPAIEGNDCEIAEHVEDGDDGWWTIYRPSTEWATGGPLIEKYKLDVDFDSNRGWSASTEDVVHWMHADTVLVAVCRTVVEHVFGDEVPE